MKSRFLKSAVLWGIGLWLFGYALGILLFPFVTTGSIGWIITPFGIVATFWVLTKKIEGNSFRDYALLSFLWTSIAIIFDYFFLVQVFKPQDGYYKIDVYLYYLMTLAIPLYSGWNKYLRKNRPPSE